MIVGIPKEIKDHEYRVAMPPGGCQALVAAGHKVVVEKGAGHGTGFGDAEYEAVGAVLAEEHSDVFRTAELVIKVKEPLASEYDLLREDSILFTFLHLAAFPDLASVLLEKRVPAIAYETIQLSDGSMPILTPMSEVAGRLAAQVAAYYLEKLNGGSGRLLGGVPGVPPAKVVVIGAGTVGTNAAGIALGMGAEVVVIDRKVDRLRYLDENFHGRLTTLSSSTFNIAAAVREADVVIGAALVTGGKAPVLVTREMVASMRPGSVIMDVAIDQGGMFETSRPTSHSDPVYTVDGVVHYCVTNMPGIVPRTSTFALANATLPYALALANLGLKEAVRRDPALARGVNTYGGHIAHLTVAEALGYVSYNLSALL